MIELPEILEVEYTFQDKMGHNTLKLVDGRLFFFSEAQCNLDEKNEYLTKVSLPLPEDWEIFLNTIPHIWHWEAEYQPEPGVSIDGDIWEIRMKHGQEFISTRAMGVDPPQAREFFQALKNLVGLDITHPYRYISQKLWEI